MMRNISEPISKPLFQPTGQYNLLFINSLSYTADSKIASSRSQTQKIEGLNAYFEPIHTRDLIFS